MKFNRLKYVSGEENAPDIFVRLQDTTPEHLNVYATDHTWQGVLFRRARDDGDAMFTHGMPFAISKQLPLRQRAKLRWGCMPLGLRCKLDDSSWHVFSEVCDKTVTAMMAAR